MRVSLFSNPHDLKEESSSCIFKSSSQSSNRETLTRKSSAVNVALWHIPRVNCSYISKIDLTFFRLVHSHITHIREFVDFTMTDTFMSSHLHPKTESTDAREKIKKFHVFLLLENCPVAIRFLRDFSMSFCSCSCIAILVSSFFISSLSAFHVMYLSHTEWHPITLSSHPLQGGNLFAISLSSQRGHQLVLAFYYLGLYCIRLYCIVLYCITRHFVVIWLRFGDIWSQFVVIWLQFVNQSP